MQPPTQKLDAISALYQTTKQARKSKSGPVVNDRKLFVLGVHTETQGANEASNVKEWPRGDNLNCVSGTVIVETEEDYQDSF